MFILRQVRLLLFILFLFSSLASTPLSERALELHRLIDDYQVAYNARQAANTEDAETRAPYISAQIKALHDLVIKLKETAYAGQLNEVDESHESFLGRAVEIGCPALASVLIKYGADVQMSSLPYHDADSLLAGLRGDDKSNTGVEIDVSRQAQAESRRLRERKAQAMAHQQELLAQRDAALNAIAQSMPDSTEAESLLLARELQAAEYAAACIAPMLPAKPVRNAQRQLFRGGHPEVPALDVGSLAAPLYGTEVPSPFPDQQGDSDVISIVNPLGGSIMCALTPEAAARTGLPLKSEVVANLADMTAGGDGRELMGESDLYCDEWAESGSDDGAVIPVGELQAIAAERDAAQAFDFGDSDLEVAHQQALTMNNRISSYKLEKDKIHNNPDVYASELLERGRIVFFSQPETGMTLLHEAALAGNEGLGMMLVQVLTGVHNESESIMMAATSGEHAGKTALDIARENELVELVGILQACAPEERAEESHNFKAYFAQLETVIRSTEITRSSHLEPGDRLRGHEPLLDALNATPDEFFADAALVAQLLFVALANRYSGKFVLERALPLLSDDEAYWVISGDAPRKGYKVMGYARWYADPETYAAGYRWLKSKGKQVPGDPWIRPNCPTAEEYLEQSGIVLP